MNDNTTVFRPDIDQKHKDGGRTFKKSMSIIRDSPKMRHTKAHLVSFLPIRADYFGKATFTLPNALLLLGGILLPGYSKHA